MSDKDKITFEKQPAQGSMSIQPEALDKEHPFESALAQIQWNNAVASIDLPGTNLAFKAHLDLDGDGKVTQGELKKVDAATQSAGDAIMINPHRNQLKSVTTTIPKVAAEKGDDKVVFTMDSAFQEYIKEVDPKLVGADEAKRIQQKIDEFLGEDGLGAIYKPDDKLTVGEKKYYDDVVKPQELKDQKAEPEAVDKSAASRA